MGHISGSIEGGRISGKARIWAGVFGGMVMASILPHAVDYLFLDGDANPDTYSPAELHVIEFSPTEGMDCTGLSPAGTAEVLAATIVCETEER